MKRLLRESKHGYQNRDSAICYIDGEIIEGKVHPDIIQDYLAQRRDLAIELLTNYYTKKNKSQDYINHQIDLYNRTNELDYEIYLELSEYKRMNCLDDLQVGFAHKIEKDKSIYVENSSLVNVDMNTVSNALKSKYPDYTIYDDDSEQNGEYLKVAKNKKSKGDNKMKRLIRKSETENKMDFVSDAVRGVLPITPSYGTEKSYMNYINGDPNSAYLPENKVDKPNVMTMDDLNKDFLEEDNFTIKKTR